MVEFPAGSPSPRGAGVLGQYQLKRIKERGLSAHAEFAQFVLDDGIEKPMVSHLDGHDSRVLDKMRFV